MWAAVESNQLKIVEDLYSCGACDIMEILKRAIICNSVDIFKWGFKKIRLVKEMVVEVLEKSIRFDRTRFIKWMFKRGAKVYLTDMYPTTDWPLISVSVTDNVKLAKILHDNGATISNTALLEASSRANSKMMRYLLDNGCDVNAESSGPLSAVMRHGFSAWSLPGGQKKIECVRLLISRGATVMVEHICNAINMIAGGGANSDLLSILLESDIDADIVNSLDGSGMTPLILACIRQQPNSMEMLLNVGADPSIRSTNGDTVFMLVDKHINGECRELLQRWSRKCRKRSLKRWSIN